MEQAWLCRWLLSARVWHEGERVDGGWVSGSQGIGLGEVDVVINS